MVLEVGDSRITTEGIPGQPIYTFSSIYLQLGVFRLSARFHTRFAEASPESVRIVRGGPQSL